MNRELNLLAEAQAERLETHEYKVIAACKDGVSALRMTAIQSGYTQETLAELLGKAKKVLSRAVTGSSSLTIDTLIKLMQISGNVFLLEYMCHRMGGKFVFYTQEEIELREAKERVAKLESRLAA
ncbi:MAG TPA: helix-turn-helix transcriptional regulator [Methylophilaceae bacterium]|jgi:transcriptional regulator with XRE-family HTH domain|nr:helix-turn-helix transcriptional regulator [Methylophilaceae bacterium]